MSTTLPRTAVTTPAKGFGMSSEGMEKFLR
jgi:hypothetical protein